MFDDPIPTPAPGDTESLAAKYARVKAVIDNKEASRRQKAATKAALQSATAKDGDNAVDKRKRREYARKWVWGFGWHIWIL